MMKALFTPTSDPLFSNIDQINTVFNGNGEPIMFEKGYYTLVQIISMLN